MTKNFFIFAVLAIFVAGAVWLLISKQDSVNDRDLSDLTGTPTATATPSGTPSASATPQGKLITMDNGLQIQDLTVGTGAEAKIGKSVTVHYVGMFKDGTVFQSSREMGQTFDFVLGAGTVIQGWDIGVQGMKVGGKRKLFIPSALAYGPRGASGLIPPNADLIFEVELLGVK